MHCEEFSCLDQPVISSFGQVIMSVGYLMTGRVYVLMALTCSSHLADSSGPAFSLQVLSYGWLPCGLFMGAICLSQSICSCPQHPLQSISLVDTRDGDSSHATRLESHLSRTNKDSRLDFRLALQRLVTWTQGLGLANNLHLMKLLFLIFIPLITMYDKADGRLSTT